MGEFPEFGDNYESQFFKNPKAEGNETSGFCFVKAAVVTCPDGYNQNSIKWKNEMNGNQNNYEFKRSIKGEIYEKIWPGGYFGPGPELQIDFCCTTVESEKTLMDQSSNLVASSVSLNMTEESIIAAQPLVVAKLGDEAPPESDYKIGLLKFGDH